MRERVRERVRERSLAPRKKSQEPIAAPSPLVTENLAPEPTAVGPEAAVPAPAATEPVLQPEAPAHDARTGHQFARLVVSSPAAPSPPPDGVPPPADQPAAPEDAGGGPPEAPAPSTRAAQPNRRSGPPDAPPPAGDPGSAGGGQPGAGQPGDLKTGATGGSSTTVAIKATTRAVSASTLNTLWEALTNSGAREAASVLPKFTPAPQYEYDDNDRVKKVVVNVLETKEMPQWQEADKQCPPIKKEWDRFYGVLDTHENKHLAIDQKHFANVHTKLVGKKKEDAWKALDDEIDAADKENEAYDTQSNHGINEGANINTAVQCEPEKVSSAAGPAAGEPPGAAAPESHGLGSDLGSSGSGVLQAKLEVSQPGDPLEDEAERVADRVLHPEGSEEVTRVAGRKSDGPRPDPADAEPLVRGVLGRPGAPLDRDTRSFMEGRLGHDFSRVRVHSDAAAAQSAAGLHALAYTLGSDVVFGAGQYAPNVPQGRRLLAHELTHVVQQAAAPGAIQRQAAPAAPPPPSMTNVSAPPPAASVVSVRLKVSTGADPEYSSNSRNTGTGVVVFSVNAEETYASFRAMGAADMWNMACVVGNLSQWAATAPDVLPQASPGGGAGGVQLSNANPADTAFEDNYRATFPHFKRHVQTFYKAFKDFQASFKDRGTKAVLGMLAESRGRTKNTVEALGIEQVVEGHSAGGGGGGGDVSVTYKSKSDKIKKLAETAARLAAKKRPLEKLLKQQEDKSGLFHWAFSSKEELEKEDQMLLTEIPKARTAWEEEKRKALDPEKGFPILSYYDTADQLDAISDSAGAAQTVGAKLFEILGNIQELEDKIKLGNERILCHEELLDRLKDGFSLTPFERQTVTYMRQKYTGDIETGQRVAVLIAIVLAAIAAAPTGGGSLIFAAAALGEAAINTALLLQAYDQWAFEKAATGSDEDKAKVISSDEPSLFWLAFQVVTTVVGLKGAGKTIMTELKGAYQEIKAGYKLAQTTGDKGQLERALNARKVPEATSKGIVARALEESKKLLEGIAKGGPEGLQAALEMLKTSPNFYGVRLAVWRLKAGANEAVVKHNLQAARQQIVNKIVEDTKAKYPKASFAVVDQGFEKPLIVKISSGEPVPAAPPPAAPSSAPPSAAPGSAGSRPAPPAAAAGKEALPPEVQGTPVKPPPSGLLVQAQPTGAAVKPGAPGAADAPSGPPASPMGAPSAPQPPIAPQAGSVAAPVNAPPAGSTAPGAFHPPMAVPEGVNQALNAAEELQSAPQAGLGGAAAAAGGDLAVQMDQTVAPFGTMRPSMQVYYGLNPNIPKPEYSGIYLTVSKRFTVNPEMTAKFAGKGTSVKVILQDTTSGATNQQLYMFKPGGGENVGVAQAHELQPGTFFVSGRASYDLAMDLPTVGKDIVPLGIVVYNGQVGSLQPFIKNTENLGDLFAGKPLNPQLSAENAKQLAKEIWETNPEFAKFRENLRAYDHVINNPDRNYGNYLVELNEDLTIKRFYAIDQDLALKPGARNVMWKEREAIPRFAQATGPQFPPTAQQSHLGKMSKTLYDEFLLMKVNESSVREALHATYNMDKATADGIFKRLDEVLQDYNLRLQTMPESEVFSD